MVKVMNKKKLIIIGSIILIIIILISILYLYNNKNKIKLKSIGYNNLETSEILKNESHELYCACGGQNCQSV